MKCSKCSTAIPPQAGYDHAGETLCEDCYIIVLSAPKTCDPWAVYSATRTASKGECLTTDQQRILDLVCSRGPISQTQICSELALTEDDFKSAFSTLRHMERLKGTRQDGEIFFVPFS
ncbi:MAG: hypothetical protein V2I36_08380 [Desulfopila sp.]|jgi:hypothetical protein|nr:hypothetical protein [Desulfopila sp.]